MFAQDAIRQCWLLLLGFTIFWQHFRPFHWPLDRPIRSIYLVCGDDAVTSELPPAKGAGRALGFTVTRPHTITTERLIIALLTPVHYDTAVAEKHAQHHAEATVSDVKEGAPFASTTELQAAATAQRLYCTFSKRPGPGPGPPRRFRQDQAKQLLLHMAWHGQQPTGIVMTNFQLSTVV